MAIRIKLHSVLKYVKDKHNAAPAKTPEQEQQEKTLRALADVLAQNNIHIIKTQDNIGEVAERVKAARARLEDVHKRLELSIKSGLVSESIH